MALLDPSAGRVELARLLEVGLEGFQNQLLSELRRLIGGNRFELHGDLLSRSLLLRKKDEIEISALESPDHDLKKEVVLLQALFAAWQRNLGDLTATYQDLVRDSAVASAVGMIVEGDG